MEFKVLVSDKLAPEGLAILKAAEGLDVDYRPGIDSKELAAMIGAYHGIVIRSGTRVTAELLGAAELLKVVGRAGIGVDNVDVDAASKRGVVVMNTPGGNNVTTAEHTISLLLALARHIPQANASLRSGEWRRGDFIGTEVFGKTLGVIGTGNIGAIVADRARGLKMRVLAYDPYITEEAATRLGVELVTLEELYRRADFITVHTPLTEETRGMVSDQAFAAMKDGVRMLNCARGGIVDEAALARALESGKVAGAALDVFAEEPAVDNPLVGMPQVVATPHLGASTDEAQLNVAVAVAEQVRDFLLNDSIINAVNVPSVSTEMAGEMAPYITLAEKIGSLHAQMAQRAPSDLLIEFHGEAADFEDGRPITSALLVGLLSNFMDVPVNGVNADILARERGIRVRELRDRESSGFASFLRVRFSGPGGEQVVGGAVFGRNTIRLVCLDDFFFEAVPEGAILVLHNKDVPGVVGRVGTFLGQAGINIAGVELGRVEGEAISFFHVDSPLVAEQLNALRGMPDITRACMVKLY
ncbi:MAG: phosphoglycerate dehydrogenase [Candidatus Binatia bacterium]